MEEKENTGSISIDELMERIKETDNKKNFRNWLNKKYPKGYDGYNSYYVLTHPWKIFQCWSREICFAYQRVFRGWDDSAIWSVDYYLSKIIPEMIAELKSSKGGIPMIMFKGMPYDENHNYSREDEERASKNWDSILDQIIDGFKAYEKMGDKIVYKGDPEYDILNEKFEKGFKLLKKYFGNLWS